MSIIKFLTNAYKNEKQRKILVITWVPFELALLVVLLHNQLLYEYQLELQV